MRILMQLLMTRGDLQSSQKQKSSPAKGPSLAKGPKLTLGARGVELSADEAYDRTLARLGLHMLTQEFCQVFMVLKTKRSR